MGQHRRHERCYLPDGHPWSLVGGKPESSRARCGHERGSLRDATQIRNPGPPALYGTELPASDM